MKQATLLLLAVCLAACASSKSSSGPNVSVELAQLTAANDVFYMRGPVSIQYQLAISNPTTQPLTLTRLEHRVHLVFDHDERTTFSVYGYFDVTLAIGRADRMLDG